MAKKLRFKPEITRVKLNPEQAVLRCQCYNIGWYHASGSNRHPSGSVEGAGCYLNSRGAGEGAVCTGSSGNTATYVRTGSATSS